MQLLVDFNMEEEDGRIPARLTPAEIWSASEGSKVLAFDGEGTECWAVIDEVVRDSRYVMLSPIKGTARASTAMAIPEARNAQMA